MLNNDSDCVQDCEQSWEAHGQHCYFWSDHIETWDWAEQFCLKKGAHLASVTSNSTNQYILRGIMKRNINENMWIGGTDKDEEGVWKWADGSPWEFTDWQTGRPGRPNERQNCLHYDAFVDFKWYDYRCYDRSYKFLCSQKVCSGIVRREFVNSSLSLSFSHIFFIQ